MSHRPLRQRPSGSVGSGSPVGVLGRVELGGRLPIIGAPEMDVLGQGVHAFLAADRTDRSREDRFLRGGMVLDRWNVAGHVGWSSLVGAADRLWAFLDRRFPGARLRREVPVFATVGSQVIVGRVDLLVEIGDRFAVIDHKSFPGRESLWDARAIAAASKLESYARAVTLATGRACAGLLAHLPVVGALSEVGSVSPRRLLPLAEAART